MKNTSDGGLEIAMAPAEDCRVAYTLDGMQPVRCTIVGDQPFFYADIEHDVSVEDALDDGFGFAAIEKSLTALRERIAALDPGCGSGEPALALRRFMDATAALSNPGDIPTYSLTTLEDTLRRSRFAAALLDLAGKHNAAPLRHSRQYSGAMYDRRTGTILIHPDLAPTDQVLLAARELRRLWQHRHGALLHPLFFHPDQAILINRTQAADLAVAMVRISWELQLAGEKDAWARLETCSMGDLARAFARESFRDFRSLSNGTAGAAAFETWFLSDRCRREDRKLIQQMLADYSGYVFGESQPLQSVTGELVIALGSVPFGKNYLAPYAQIVVKDPVFTEVRDRSNANFLWFIKFERSYRDTEAATQVLTAPLPDIHPIDKHMPNQAAEIITMPKAAKKTRGVAKNDTNKGNTSAQIISFRTGSTE